MPDHKLTEKDFTYKPFLVQARKVGSQIVAVIPPSLGYGSQAQGTIPANSTLVFVVDILGIQSK